jgi:chorismate mutase
MQEMDVKGSLAKCIRVLILCETDKQKDEMVHVYLREARSLRPDWVKEK